MKKAFLPVMLLFLLSSCGRRDAYVIELRHETEAAIPPAREEITVIINKNSGTFHLDAACPYLVRMKEENRMELCVESLDVLLTHDFYKPCSKCAEKNDTQTNVLP